MKTAKVPRHGGPPMATPAPIPERSAHPYLTHDMILEIPGAIAETLRGNGGRVEELVARMRGRKRLYFTGCGTALFAAMLGERVMASVGPKGILTSSVQALELSHYPPPLDRSCTVVGVSHSGITKATVDALDHARRRGAFTVGITHFADRPIAKVADRVVIAGNGPDRSRCHTKCYVAGALAAAQVGLALLRASGDGSPKGVDAVEAGLRELPRITERVLRSVARSSEALAGEYLAKRTYNFAGAGPNVPTALEAALKMEETSYVAAEGMQTEQMLHGPWVALDEESLVFVIAPRGPSHWRSLDLMRAARTVGTSVVGLVEEGDDEGASLCDDAIELPPAGETLTPFVAILPLYLFAYYSAVKRGFNPDLLRYLTPRYWEARQIVFPPGTH